MLEEDTFTVGGIYMGSLKSHIRVGKVVVVEVVVAVVEVVAEVVVVVVLSFAGCSFFFFQTS